MAPKDKEKKELIAQFRSVTSAPEAYARQMLERNGMVILVFNEYTVMDRMEIRECSGIGM